MNRQRVVVSWSSGKDSAWTLHLLRQRDDIEVVGLITTVNQAFNRVAMHSTRAEILSAQALAAALPLKKIALPWPCSNEQYESCMRACVDDLVAAGVQAVAFGDLFLEDIRSYRENQLEGTGLKPIFPLWNVPTRELASQMIDAGLRAKIVCVDPKKLDASFAGREFDFNLLRDLPAGVDRCGENGEFHTCVYAGPMFSGKLLIETGEVVQRDGFIYSDAILNRHSGASSVVV